MSQDHARELSTWLLKVQLSGMVKDLTAQLSCCCLGKWAHSWPKRDQVQLGHLFFPKASLVQSWWLSTLTSRIPCPPAGPACFCPEPTWPFANPVYEWPGKSPVGVWAWQALADDSKTAPLDITMKGEEQSQVSGALLIHRSISKHRRRFQNPKPLANTYHSPQANETSQVKSYQHIRKISVVRPCN